VTAIIGVALTLVLLGGTAVVLTEKPTRQAIMLSSYGVLLGVLFLSLSAPDANRQQSV
jgi:energy-converting hydrogenase B subunit D